MAASERDGVFCASGQPAARAVALNLRFKFKMGGKMIEIKLYKDILCITIDESRIERFCALFAEREFELKQGGEKLKCDRGMRLKFARGERSEAVVTKNCVSILASEREFNEIAGLLENYLRDDRRFPLDISLEQLGFAISPPQICDIVFECGEFKERA